MGPPYLKGLDVPSQYMQYQQLSQLQQQAKVGFFRVGLSKARKVMNPPAAQSTYRSFLVTS